MRLLLIILLITAKTCSHDQHQENLKIVDARKTNTNGGPAGSARSTFYSIRLLGEKEIEFDSLYTVYQTVKIQKEDIKVIGDTILLECLVKEEDKFSQKNIRALPGSVEGKAEAAISYYIKKSKYYIIIPTIETKQKSNIP